MVRPRRCLAPAVILGAASILAGCGGETGAAGSTGTAIAPSTSASAAGSASASAAGSASASAAAEPAGPPTKCPIAVARTGKPLTQPELDKLLDPVARIVLQAGEGCPATFAEVQAKLAKLDVKGCEPGAAGAPANGVKTRIVSERSQVLGALDRSRAAVSRQCDGRKPWGLFLSIFGVEPKGDALPDDVELIGYDAERGVFDFWALEKGKWTFFGDSLDLIGDGYDCAGGACKAIAAEKTRCAECHTGGGLVMKELNTPWVHWEGDTTVTTPGVAALIAKFPAQLGGRSEGADLEINVNAGNHDWIKKRVGLLQAKGAAEVLRPLFCTVQINLQSGAAPATTAAKIGTLPGSMNAVLDDFFLDPFWGKADNVPIKSADYAEFVKKYGQRVAASDGARLEGKGKKAVTDTFFPFTYPERAAEDVEYVHRLVSAGIVDDDFVRDVLAVDFTRPIFSAERCGLLAFAPALDAASLKPAAIREGFVAKLKAASPAQGSPPAQLLASLEAKDDAKKHTADVEAFLSACKARPSKELLDDVLQIAATLRSRARALKIMEFGETMVVDDLKPSAAWLLDPASCKKIER